MLYNYGDEPNPIWEKAADEECVIVFTVLRDIELGQLIGGIH
ncbi:hypothetical protein [Streptomyces capitiformicae]|nr:hypothetical protein [Streptomyces capitiformicae]